MAPKKQKAVVTNGRNSASKRAQYDFPNTFYSLAVDLKKLFFKPAPETVIPGQIVIIDKFFSKAFCNELVKSFETGLSLETTPLVKSRDYAARFNDRISLTNFAAADSLWQYLRKVLLAETFDETEAETREEFEEAIGLNPQLRVYRYNQGHHFGKHYDEAVSCPVSEKPGSKKGTTKWTLLIYLTGDDEFVGGGTIFHPELRGVKPLNVHPSKGMALLHKHGDDCLKHEAEIVKSGTKWVLRSDVVYVK